MAKVVIAFHADHKKIGNTVDLDDEEAAALVREGRARYAESAGGRATSSTKAPSKQDSASAS